MSKEEIIFTEGLSVKKVNDFKFGISLNVDKFTEFLKKHKKESGYVNIDICKSKEKASWYGKLNTWKPEEKNNENIVSFAGEEEIPF